MILACVVQKPVVQPRIKDRQVLGTNHPGEGAAYYMVDLQEHLENNNNAKHEAFPGVSDEKQSQCTAHAPHCRSSTAPYMPSKEEEKALNKEFGIKDKPREERGLLENTLDSVGEKWYNKKNKWWCKWCYYRPWF